MDLKDLEQNGLEMSVGDKIIKVKGHFNGNFFCVDRKSIDDNPLLAKTGKDNLKRQLLSDRNIQLSE